MSGIVCRFTAPWRGFLPLVLLIPMSLVSCL